MLGLSLSLNSFFAMSIGKYEEARAMLDEALPLLREDRGSVPDRDGAQLHG